MVGIPPSSQGPINALLFCSPFPVKPQAYILQKIHLFPFFPITFIVCTDDILSQKESHRTSNLRVWKNEAAFCRAKVYKTLSK